jgi:hypothetical protein
MKFRENDLLLKLDNWFINVEFYSLSNIFYFIILLYRAENICVFLGGLQFQDLNAPSPQKKIRPPGDYWFLKVSTLKVNVQCDVCLKDTQTLSQLCKLRTEFKSSILHKRSGTVRGSRLSQWYKMKSPFFQCVTVTW